MSDNQEVVMIAAMAENRAIGYKNHLLVKQEEDLKHFQNTTLGHIVIMGRKTAESIGRPLKGRMNIIISSNPYYKHKEPGFIVAGSLHAALVISSYYTDRDIFIIGGGQIYEEALPIVDKIILTMYDSTVVPRTIKADTFFPHIPVKFKLHCTKYLTSNVKVFTYYQKK